MDHLNMYMIPIESKNQINEIFFVNKYARSHKAKKN